MQWGRVRPEIYCLDRSLIDVLLERYHTYDIFWYHWPSDGLLTMIQDYEPVIISYKEDGSICFVVVRKAWDFVTTLGDQLILPLKVYFDKLQHHPVVLTDQKNHAGLTSRISLSYSEVNILSNQIPDMYRTGLFHLSNYRLTRREDPDQYAARRYLEFC